jgi:glycosyltransferase involved in cell wall biosynthesis
MQVDQAVQLPRVSVVIIFFNTAAYFEDAIRSVLDQDYPHWELLLIDDGSSDGSDAIATRFAAQHPTRIRHLHHPGRANLGMSASRNLGIAHARGELIAMLDADDAWASDMLSHQVRCLDANPRAAMVYGPVERWYSWSHQPSGRRDFVALPLGDYDRPIEPPEIVRHILQTQYGVPLGVLMRKEAVEAVGGYEDSFRGLCEDMAFFSKFCLRHTVYVSSRCGYRYRQHEHSSVETAFREGAVQRGRLRFLSWLQSHFRQEGVDDRELWRALRRQRFRFKHPEMYRRLSEMRGLSSSQIAMRLAQKMINKLGGIASGNR